MHRGVVALTIALACGLTGCATGSRPIATTSASGGASAPAATAPPAAAASTPPPSSPSAPLDGDRILWIEKPRSSCPQSSGKILSIEGSDATYHSTVVARKQGLTFPGTSALDGTNVTVGLRYSATDSRETDLVDLAGKLADPDTVTGKGTSGGIHPSGETGYSCRFRFTLTRMAAGYGDDCTSADVQAAVLDSDLARARIEPDTLKCSGRWALALVVPGTFDDTGAVVWGVAVRSNGTKWVRRPFPRSCLTAGGSSAGAMPGDLASQFCGG